MHIIDLILTRAAGSIAALAPEYTIQYRSAEPIEAFLKRHGVLSGLLNLGNGVRVSAMHRAVVVAYAPIGQLVARRVQDEGEAAVCANRDGVRIAREAEGGGVALATRGSILQELGSTPEQLAEVRERIRIRLISTYSETTA